VILKRRGSTFKSPIDEKFDILTAPRNSCWQCRRNTYDLVELTVYIRNIE